MINLYRKCCPLNFCTKKFPAGLRVTWLYLFALLQVCCFELNWLFNWLVYTKHRIRQILLATFSCGIRESAHTRRTGFTVSSGNTGEYIDLFVLDPFSKMILFGLYDIFPLRPRAKLQLRTTKTKNSFVNVVKVAVIFPWLYPFLWRKSSYIYIYIAIILRHS